MRYPFIILVLLSISLNLSAGKYVVTWMDTLDNSGDDDAYAIAVDTDGYLYVTGMSYINSNYWALTLKYSPSGSIVWADTFVCGVFDAFMGITVDESGFIYTTGSAYIGTDVDCITVKYDSTGTIIWVDTLNLGGDEYGYGIATDKTGDVYVTGYTFNGSNYDCFTVRYDSDGNTVWVDTIDNGRDDTSHDIVTDGLGHVYITGYLSTGSNVYFYTVKYDTSGELLWSDSPTSAGQGVAYGIAIDVNGNVYVTGYLYLSGESDYLTIKYSPDGNILHVDTLDNASTEEAKGIFIDMQGNIYLTGRTYIQNWDYLTVKYDTMWNIVWMDTIDMGSDDEAEGVVVDMFGNVYVTGRSYIGSNKDFLTVRYSKFVDAGIISITSPDTGYTDSSYTPTILVKNNSYEDTLNIDIACYVDSAGIHVYTDLKSVFSLSPGDSTGVVFDPWNTPSQPNDYTLRFSLLTTDMDPENDTLSKPLYVREATGIFYNDSNFKLHPPSLCRPGSVITYYTNKKAPYTLLIIGVDGRLIKRIKGNGKGLYRLILPELPTGIYFIKLLLAGNSMDARFILVKQ